MVEVPTTPRRLEPCSMCRQRLCPDCIEEHRCSPWLLRLRNLCCLARLQFDEFPQVRDDSDDIRIQTANLFVSNVRSFMDAWAPVYQKITTSIHHLLEQVENGLETKDEELMLKIEGETIFALVMLHLKLLVTFGLPRLKATAREQGIDETTLGALNDVKDRAGNIIKKYQDQDPQVSRLSHWYRVSQRKSGTEIRRQSRISTG